MTQINIKDESGDRDCFTIIPNYIANHSTANDQALYFQMKRFAGENGRCFATEETLMKKMGIGKKAYDKSLKYLIDKGWISYTGLTKGKTRPIKTYKVNNIWKLNNETYKKIPSKSDISFRGKISSENTKDISQKQCKIPSKSNAKEEPVLLKTNNNIATQGVAGNEINDLIDLFKDVNPAWERLFSNKTQRAAIERLLKKMPREELGNLINYLPKTNIQKYAPVITTPAQLEYRLGDLMFFIKKQENDKRDNTPIIL
jgi:hypothetical protein